MKKTIFLLSLFFAIWGIILCFFFLFFDFKNPTEFLNYIVFSCNPYHYSGMDIYVITKRTSKYDYESTSIPLINLFFYLSFLAGSLIYYFSKYKEIKLLAFNYSLVFFSCIVKIFFFFSFFSIEKLSFHTIIYLLTFPLYIFISYYFITKYLNSNAIYNDKEMIENNLESATNSKRFLNLIIDSFIIIIITFGFLSYLERDENLVVFGYLKTAFGNKLGIIVLFSLIKFIYYLTFESIFKSTPAKFLTECYVTDDDGNSPDFSTILKRTILRFVPLESLSFLMGKNLHDVYSYTNVINKKTDSQIEKRYLKILSIGFLIVLFIYFYNLSARNHF